MSLQLRVGFIGLGYWGTRLARAAQRAGQIEIVGGFARTPQARDGFRGEFGGESFSSAEELLRSDVEAVSIATPINTHVDYVEAAAAAGKHVLVEKPLSLDVASARRATDAAAAARVVLQVGHQRRRLAATRSVAGWALAGELGTIHSMEATVFNSDGLNPPDNWKFDPAQRVLGAMSQQGVHMIDNMIYVAGRARRVMAFATNVLSGSVGFDASALLIDFESGPVGVLSNSAVGSWVASFAVHGTSGSGWSEHDGGRLFRQTIDEQERIELSVEPTDPLAEQWSDFVASVRSGSQPEVAGEGASEVVAVLEAGALSVERGVPVHLDELRP